MISSLWCEEFRPATLDGYVFQNNSQKEQILSWVKEQNIPHLLLSGGPGCGKTALAQILVNELHIDPYDVLEINASRENSVDHMRDVITNFVSTMPFGKMKVVILQEGDYLTINSQAILRALMEDYNVGSRFIITCNYPNKIIPAIHSRCQGFHIDKLDNTEFTSKLAEILLAKNIDFDLDILDTFVKASYPDLRKAINNIQQYSKSGILALPDNSNNSSQDSKLDALTLFKAGKIREGRQLILSQFRPDESNDWIRLAYDNLSLFAKTTEQEDQAILAIRKAAVNDSLVSDREINISAMLCELSQISEG